MSNPENDPAKNTQQFKAFAQRGDDEKQPQREGRVVFITAGIFAVVIVIGLIFLYIFVLS
ncbi:hypothetical protein [Bailinhaonella thermotolerans]|uniref:Uncharacterized protein n=1 Tax=Bailinhaonella thermotolerans TaxID=1070861 RepID=A0A3A4AYP3_9ACTN|nr:hypothetical protein [Bailinhaonella thermotolerans]RJL30370.1 hypothetical protein D5H75_22600 [Bailinhaonella thermotolerans]